MDKENVSEPVVFRYRSRELSLPDIHEIQALSRFYAKGRTYISRELCQA